MRAQALGHNGRNLTRTHFVEICISTELALADTTSPSFEIDSAKVLLKDDEYVMFEDVGDSDSEAQGRAAHDEEDKEVRAEGGWVWQL